MTDREQIIDRIAREGRRPTETGLWGRNATLFMLSLTGVLTAMLVLAHVPWAASTPRLGWDSPRDAERITFTMVEHEVEPPEEEDPTGGSPAPVTSHLWTTEPAEVVEPVESSDVGLDDQEDSNTEKAMGFDQMERMRILEFAEEQPDIVGGLNALYLNVRYPKAAQDAGIQGLVVLQFVVELDGTTSNIEVIKSLHPLCDDAAAEAVERTKFRPARQNGHRVRVRMNLPIRFVLLNEPVEAKDPAADPESGL